MARKAGSATTSEMDVCDLIVRMEQAEISQRSVVGAIVVVSGLAVSFLLWLLYVHHASADFAGRWMFLPALNALLNGLCRDCALRGIVFHQTSQPGSASHEHAAGFRVLLCFPHQLHREPRTARRHDFPWPRPRAHAVPFYFSQPRNPFHRRAADGAHDVLLLADGPVRDAPANRPLDVPHLALCFDHRRGGLRVPQGVCVLDPRSCLVRAKLLAHFTPLGDPTPPPTQRTLGGFPRRGAAITRPE
jgi:hypothetical protein